MKRIAIFASGSGTNAQNIIEYFNKSDKINVVLVLSNNKNAFVLERAKKLNVPSVTFDREQFYQSEYVVDLLLANKIDLIVLAGFLRLVPKNILQLFQNKIINIHPALLPKYGGKGMYGLKVHETVIENKETESGISIHYVNEEYDKGDVFFQTKCRVDPSDTPEILAQRVHQLEYEHFPKQIEKLLNKQNQ